MVRAETPGDVDAVRRVVTAAFGRPAEAQLVDALRARGALTLSLVADEGGAVRGHIAFSEVSITRESGIVRTALGLAPMAVEPGHQRRGLGSQLVRSGLEQCRALGHGVVVVVGHPAYYPRFGFVPGRPLGIRWEIDVPDDAFMVAELQPGALIDVRGVVRYQSEFTDV
jgi:putative acetyltransferase